MDGNVSEQDLEGQESSMDIAAGGGFYFIETVDATTGYSVTAIDEAEYTQIVTKSDGETSLIDFYRVPLKPGKLEERVSERLKFLMIDDDGSYEAQSARKKIRERLARLRQDQPHR